MTPAKFQIGQNVRICIEMQARRREIGYHSPCEGTILEIREIDGRRRYQVGGRIDNDPDKLWNADFRESELATVAPDKPDPNRNNDDGNGAR